MIEHQPTLEEIQKIIEYPDRRIKHLILCMVWGGYRLGAWDYLKMKHVIPIKNKEDERSYWRKTTEYNKTYQR